MEDFAQVVDRRHGVFSIILQGGTIYLQCVYAILAGRLDVAIFVLQGGATLEPGDFWFWLAFKRK